MPEEIKPLSKAVREFVVRWGEAARYWGLPRSAAQIHGLLLASETPLSAEEIATHLSIARSNVSTSLKELRTLGVIRTAVDTGARRERFEALDDPWEAAANIVAARRAREFDAAALALADAAKSTKGEAGKRLTAYAALTDMAGDWADDLSAAPRERVLFLMKAGSKVADVVGGKKRKKKKK